MLSDQFMPFPVVDQENLLTSYLGRGGFSKVFKGENSQGEFVMKVIRKDKQFTRQKERTLAFHEYAIMKRIPEHPNIVNLLGANLDGTQNYQGEEVEISYIAMEFCEKGSLMAYMQKQFDRMDQEMCRFYFLQVLAAVQHLHQQGVAHLDIKPDNILLDSQFNAKLGDFGIAQFMGDKVGHLSAKLGTESYMAPEILGTCKDTPYCPFKADMYSCGALLYTMLTGEKLGKDIPSSCGKSTGTGTVEGTCSLNKKSSDFVFGMSDTYCPNDLLKWLLCEDPQERPTIEEVLQHPWLAMEFSQEALCNIFSEMERRHTAVASSQKSTN